MAHRLDTREDLLSAGYFGRLANPHKTSRELRAAEGRSGQFQMTTNPVLSNLAFRSPSMTEVLLNHPPGAWLIFLWLWQWLPAPMPRHSRSAGSQWHLIPDGALEEG